MKLRPDVRKLLKVAKKLLTDTPSTAGPCVIRRYDGVCCGVGTGVGGPSRGADVAVGVALCGAAGGAAL